MGVLKKFDKAYSILKDYNGENPYILTLKHNAITKGYGLTDFNIEYILNNYDYKIEKVNKTIKIADFFGEKLKEKYNIDFVPKKVALGFIIGEMGDSLHCYIKWRQSQEYAALVYLPKKAILDDIEENKMDEVKVDFNYFDKISNRTLKEHQKSGVKFLLAKKKAILADVQGLGKALPNSMVIPTPDGKKKISDIKVGDILFSSNGEPTKVLGVFPQGERTVYKIRFSDGVCTYSDIEHLWIVKERGTDEWKVLSLREICDNMIKFGIQYQIPITKPVKYDFRYPKDLPYMIGRYIMEFDKHKKEDEEWFYKLCESLNMDTDPYNISIPDYYLQSQLMTRYGLLWGMATSMYSSKGVMKFRSKKLFDTTLELIYSLGKLADFNEENLTIKVETAETMNRHIISIEESHKEECTCFKVDSDDESFLIENYIVTHNTTTLTVASLAGNFKKVLIICPASLKSTWRDELMNYIDESEITIVNGKTWKESKYTILNYDILKNFYEIPMVYDEEKKKYVKSRRKADIQKALENSQLFQSKFDLVIIDECHKLSRNTSTRYKIIDDFLKKSKPNSIYLTSGTPITNNTKNLYNILKLINSDVVKDYEYYMRRYCGAKKIHNKKLNRDILIPTGNTNLEELMERIKGHYIRRTLKDVNLDIPFTTDVLKYDFDESQQKMYDKLWNQYLESQEKEGMEAYKPIIEGTLLRKWAAVEMLPKTYDIVDDHIEYGGKAVIMCTFDDEIEELSKHYGNKCVVYNGKMNLKQKDKAKDEFINDPNKQVFIGNLIAAGVGLTLIVADLIVFNSFSWVPGENEQAERRIIRIGQDKSCRIVYQVFNNSIFEKMYNVVSQKQNDINTVIKTENEKI